MNPVEGRGVLISTRPHDPLFSPLGLSGLDDSWFPAHPTCRGIPSTVTVGNGVGFFLRPYNFFDEDPSINSADSIYFQKNQDAGSCEVNSLNCLPQAAICAPDLPAFSDGGFFHN